MRIVDHSEDEVTEIREQGGAESEVSVVRRIIEHSKSLETDDRNRSE